MKRKTLKIIGLSLLANRSRSASDSSTSAYVARPRAVSMSIRLSFDDLIELRFLPSRRRRRDPEYFEQLKSMIMPREVNHRVSREDRRAALLALTRSATHAGKSGWNAGGPSYLICVFRWTRCRW
jgi:hypothetical protein